jgi:hypothetical protein
MKNKYWIFRIVWYACLIIAAATLEPRFNIYEIIGVWMAVGILAWLIFFRKMK